MASATGRQGALAAYARVRGAVVLGAPALWLSVALLLAGPALLGGSTHSVVLSGVAVVLAGVFLAAGAAGRTPVLVPARTVPVRAEAQAPTPYWCHVDVPARPARPRAPGRR